MSGESINVSNDTGVNWIPSADSLERGNAEANFQPVGSCNWAAKFTPLAATPFGYSNSVFQLMTTRFALEEAAAVKPSGSEGSRKSSATSTASAPSGTVSWNA